MLSGRNHASTGMLGKHHSEETKRKIALSNSIAHMGKRPSEETKKRMSISHSGEKAWQWKGDNAGYRAVHIWLCKHLGKPTKCEHCEKDGLVGHQIHWANKDHKYKRLVEDWIRLCAKCHGAYDKV